MFKNGQWWDVWNDTPDSQPYPNPDYEWAEAIATDGWCGCGQPERIVTAMRDYLNLCATQAPIPDDLATLVIAYRADELELTEHGGSIFGAWLTDAGERWLALEAATRSTQT